MNFSAPLSRNHFHPAWLLLPVPPLVAFLCDGLADTGPLRLALFLRLACAALLLGALFGLRGDALPGTGQRLLKELRAQLPGGLLALLLPGMFGWYLDGDSVPWAVGTFGLGCLLIGASAFGSEFEQRTLGNLLTQPISRSRIYLEKMAVVAALILLASLNLLLTLVTADGFHFDLQGFLEVLVVAVFALGSGPLFSLLSRSTLAGIVFTVTVPGGLFALSLLVFDLAYRWLRPGEELPMPSVSWVLGLGAPVYLLTTLLWGWRAFATLQLRDGGAGGRSSTALHPLSRPVDRLLAAVLPPRHALAQLVRKELRIHVVPWLVAGLTVGLWALGLGIRWSAPESEAARTLNDVGTLSVFAGMLGSLGFIIAGTAAVAEERELGTLENQLSQPISLARQWVVKAGVAAILAITLGALLPAGLIWLSFDAAKLQATFGELPGIAGVAYGTVFVLLLTLSLYASSVARNTMMATATAVFIGGGLACLIAGLGMAGGTWLNSVMERHVEQWPPNVNVPAWAPSAAALEQLAVASLAVVGGLVALAFLILGGRNFRRLVVPGATLARQLLGVGLALTLALGLGALVFSQLALLRAQANQAEAFVFLRASAAVAVREELRLGRLTEELAGQIGVATNATPEAVVDALIAREGNQAFVRIQERFQPKQPVIGGNPPFQMDPLLARRYGLVPALDTNTESPTSRTNAAPPATHRTDPALMKR
jgi:ABC-type transport system involved in multi-copper enzyme maturation permease subunit